MSILIFVVDARVLGCVADSLQVRRFARTSPSDYKDTKANKYFEGIGIMMAHGRCRSILAVIYKISTQITSDKLMYKKPEKNPGEATYNIMIRQLQNMKTTSHRSFVFTGNLKHGIISRVCRLSLLEPAVIVKQFPNRFLVALPLSRE